MQLLRSAALQPVKPFP